MPLHRRSLRPLALCVVIGIVGLAIFLAVSSSSSAAPTVTTDKADYYSNEIVTITGTGFSANAWYDIPVIRPDGSIVKGDGTFTLGWDSVKASSSGSFVYSYQLDGIKGVYTVEVFPKPWGGPSSGQTPLATTTFTDADIDFTQCRNDANNDNVPDACDWSTGSANANNAIYKEGDAIPQRLFHHVSAAGTYTFAFEYDFSKANVYAYDFLTNVDTTQSGALLNECGNRPSFVTAAQCTAMFTTNAQLAAIPSDPFGPGPADSPPSGAINDTVALRENPPRRGRAQLQGRLYQRLRHLQHLLSRRHSGVPRPAHRPNRRRGRGGAQPGLRP